IPADPGAARKVPAAGRDAARAAGEESPHHLRASCGDGGRPRAGESAPRAGRRPAAQHGGVRPGLRLHSVSHDDSGRPRRRARGGGGPRFWVRLRGRQSRWGFRPADERPSRLDILVEPMGRINFGAEMADRKGLAAPVRLGGETLTGWKVFPLPLDDGMLAGLKFKAAGRGGGPAFWHASVGLGSPGDTFLDMRGWGKGVVWVNGHCLGRYWSIGPTQTAYAPGCWLRAGANEVVVLDLSGPTDPVVAGLAAPILDQLRPGLDFPK